MQAIFIVWFCAGPVVDNCWRPLHEALIAFPVRRTGASRSSLEEVRAVCLEVEE